MNESEIKATSSADASMGELRDELNALRTSFAATLILLFVFSFCVNVFLFRQATAMSAQAKQASFMVTAWAPNGPAQVQSADFWNKLTDFSKSHPDFVPIITKYSPYINSRPASATAPAMIPPLAPKK